MSFEAYLDTIEAKTGKTPQRFIKNGATISGKHINSGGTHSDPTDTLKLSGKDN